MVELLDRLGNPQRSFDAVHVVGTKGKSTSARQIAATIGGVAYTSPHVSGWHERLQTDEAGFERAIQRVRAVAEELGATQFETLTAAAFKDFEGRGVTAVGVEAGLGGRLDATNVIDARVVLLTNVALEHTAVLGTTREAIAREKLAVAGPNATVVLGEPEWEALVPGRRVLDGGAREAAEVFLGRPIAREVSVSLPGRLERRGSEIWDGAHTPEAADWLLGRLSESDYVLCVSILADKNVDAILERLARAGRTLVATRSLNPRAIPEMELATRAEPYFEHVEAIADPALAVRRSRELAGDGGRVLVTGSLYLLADLYDAGIA